MIAQLGKVQYGDTPVVYATSVDELGVIANPTAVTVKTRSPSGTETTYSSPTAALSNTTTGVWKFAFPSALTEAGTWYVRFKATAGVIDVEEASFIVEPSNFATP